MVGGMLCILNGIRVMQLCEELQAMMQFSTFLLSPSLAHQSIYLRLKQHCMVLSTTKLLAEHFYDFVIEE